MEHLLQAFPVQLAPWPLAFIVMGVAAGAVVGAIPGLGHGMPMALALPLIFFMTSTTAQMLLIGMHVCVVGFLMVVGRLPFAPFLIGFILAPIGEASLRSALMGSYGSIWPLFTRPISATPMVALVAIPTAPWLCKLWKRRGRASARVGASQDRSV